MPERILVVEDEESIARGLKGDLELEGYSVDVITDGDEALSRILEQTYDLLLLDIMLPGIDGYEICREVRKRGISVPIICLTAKTQEAEIILGLDLGADDYITKPFSPRELVWRLRTQYNPYGTHVPRKADSADPNGIQVACHLHDISQHGFNTRSNPGSGLGSRCLSLRSGG